MIERRLLSYASRIKKIGTSAGHIMSCQYDFGSGTDDQACQQRAGAGECADDGEFKLN